MEIRQEWTTPADRVTRTTVAFKDGRGRVAMREGESRRLVLPESMRGWRVSVMVNGMKVALGLVARSGRALAPVITPPGQGSYTVIFTGREGEYASVRIAVFPS